MILSRSFPFERDILLLDSENRLVIYLDHNASTPMSPEVIAEMSRVASIAFGNPGSRHLAGRRARQILEDAREDVAKCLGAQPVEVVFTSGATEATNIALHGTTFGRSGRIIAPAGEHPATAEFLTAIQKAGRIVEWLPLDEVGRIHKDAVLSFDPENATLFTGLLANNETGVIQDFTSILERCKIAGVPTHIDAVQAAGKIPLNFRELQATSMSVAAHKFHGPRGIGALIVSETMTLTPLMRGGFQESGLRPGTESVVLAHGMSIALQQACRELEERNLKLKHLRDRLESGLLACFPTAVVNGDRQSRLPNTSNISFVGCEGDALLIGLDLAGVCASLGSACASGSIEPSPVLVAMGLPAERSRSALRLSVGVTNTEAEIDRAITLIHQVVERLIA